MMILALIMVSAGRSIGISENGVDIEGWFSTQEYTWREIETIDRTFDAPSFGFELTTRSGRLIKISSLEVTEHMEREMNAHGYYFK